MAVNTTTRAGQRQSRDDASWHHGSQALAFCGKVECKRESARSTSQHLRAGTSTCRLVGAGQPVNQPASPSMPAHRRAGIDRQLANSTHHLAVCLFEGGGVPAEGPKLNLGPKLQPGACAIIAGSTQQRIGLH